MAKKKQDEQTELLREILAELRRLNAKMERMHPAKAVPQEIEDVIDAEQDNDSEELEYFE